MNDAHREALSRTTLLLNQELFNGQADEAAIADTLLATTIRLSIDAGNLASRAGEATFIASFMLVGRLGIGIELDAPDAPLLDRAAPLRKSTLVEALLELGRDLIPGALVRTVAGEVAEAFVFGNTVASRGRPPIRVVATDFAVALSRGGAGAPCSGNLPLGGFAGAAAVAAAALEAAIPLLEAAVDRPAKSPRPRACPPVEIDLGQLFPELADEINVDLGPIDVISGGAITHSLLYCLLRIPDLTALVRVIEEQSADLSNVNRYALLRASDAGKRKTAQLEDSAGGGVAVSGVPCLFTKETREDLAPLADRVLVGADDVEARWWVQQEDPTWLCVGATGNHLAQVTTHVRGGPCAGCAHPVPLPPQTVPTISFVSFWAGLLQACALVCGASPVSANVVVYPFALGGTIALQRFALVPRTDCPLRCGATT